jgi:hypothetical protein
MGALVGSQQVHLAATVEGVNPTSGAFPACGAITPLNPFPPSPSPAYTLIAANVVGGPYAYSSLNYPQANCALEVEYFVGPTRQTSKILLIETYATVIAGWS